MNSNPITIQHIFISPGHNYFGRPKAGPGEHPTPDVDAVEARTGLGLVGDRYYAVPAQFGLARLSPAIMRRNIVTQGVNLNQLLGHEFELDFGDHLIRFAGTKACSPCGWMDAAIAPGAWKFLKGRGGLRARVLSDGVIRKGRAILRTAVELDVKTITEPIPRRRLPR
jgi:hypothetical protein